MTKKDLLELRQAAKGFIKYEKRYAEEARSGKIGLSNLEFSYYDAAEQELRRFAKLATKIKVK